MQDPGKTTCRGLIEYQVKMLFLDQLKTEKNEENSINDCCDCVGFGFSRGAGYEKI